MPCNALHPSCVTTGSRDAARREAELLADAQKLCETLQDLGCPIPYRTLVESMRRLRRLSNDDGPLPR